MKLATRHLIRDYGGTIVIAVSIALLIRFVLLEAYRIPSSAMRPTLEPGDTIFVTKWPFGLKSIGIDPHVSASDLPVRGEIIVFSFPENPNRDYIKRVLGLPGEEIEIRNGRTLINGKILPFTPGPSLVCGQEILPEGLPHEICLEPPVMENLPAQKVPAGSYFVIGDSRTQGVSEPHKTKSWGMIPAHSIKGKALWLWLSIEPRVAGRADDWGPKVRFDRMFRRIK